jgi:hypothetical protein
MTKLFVFTVSLDEGVSEMWHFRATDTLSIAQFILNNRKEYADLLDYLPIGKKVEELTAATLLRLIENSSIDGDSAYGFQIFEMDESEITDIPKSEIEALEPINPNFISDEQLKSLASVETFYRSENTDFNNLFNTPLILSETETLFIQKMSEQQRHSRTFYEMRDEKSIFNFIAPIVFQIRESTPYTDNLNSEFHQYPIKTVVNEAEINTHIDWMIYSGYDTEPNPIFILEANWQRPSSLREYQVILAKLLAVMHQFTELKILYGGYFGSSNSFDFCQLKRQENNTFEFHISKGFTTSHELTSIYKALKYFLTLKVEKK